MRAEEIPDRVGELIAVGGERRVPERGEDMSTFDVGGKVTLVTGANRGIGTAITASLIEAGAGVA